VSLFAALGCSAQPCLAQLTLKPTAHHLKSGGALRAQAAQNRAVRTVINHTGLCCARRPPRQHSTRRAPSHLALAYGMAPHSHADVPVLAEWHVARNRPHACGVEGCNAQLVTKTHLEARLCAAHITCPAVLRGGVLQRWCGNCHRFHMPGAFSASARCAPCSCWGCSGYPDAPVCSQVHAHARQRVLDKYSNVP